MTSITQVAQNVEESFTVKMLIINKDGDDEPMCYSCYEDSREHEYIEDYFYKQEAAIARILYFFERHWEELLKFSRRTKHQLERWAARYGYKDKPKDILDHAKNGVNNGRYSCVNLQNGHTVEFRMFRGTLKLNTIIATLQLVNRICDVAFSLTDDELKDMSWTTFVSGCVEPELIEYLKERRIYINEPVDSEEDI